MFGRKTILIGLFLLVIFGISTLQAQMITVYPNEYSEGLSNPMKGFRPSVRGTNNYPNFNDEPYPTIHRHYIYWNDIENHHNDGIDKIRDYCNNKWAGCEAANYKMIPRVILQYGDGEYYWPSDLQAGNYNQTELKWRVRRMIRRLGQLWDTDPRVAWVQTGIIGKWGEQESPTGVDDTAPGTDSTWVEIMGEEFANAFPNKKLIVRNQEHWDPEGYEWGVYWDSFAHTDQYWGSWSDILSTTAEDRYLTQFVEGEIAYDWGSGRDNFGYTPTETVSTPSYYNFVINTIMQLHCSALGWVSGYDKNSSTEYGASQMQKAFGYRFLIPEFSCSARTDPGNTMNVNFKVKNVGAAAMYYNWQLAVVLIDESSRQIVETIPLSGANTDISQWLPGRNFDWDPINNSNGSKTYLTPAETYTINSSVIIPSSMSTGQYLVGLTILEPSTQLPGLFFAVENFFKESQTQPLARIGIGTNVSNNTVSGPFDDPVDDDARYYSSTPITTYSLSTSATNGSVSPSGGNFTENSTIIVTATPNAGYAFDYWSGDLSGSTNPTQLYMNANKNVTAHFTYTGGGGGESVPWVEDFTKSNGTTSDGAPTSWTATRSSGTFEVNGNRLMLNNGGSEGVFTTGEIDISGLTVDVSLDMVSEGGLESNQDYVKLFKKVDGGSEVLVDEKWGVQSSTTLSGSGINGSTLELVIRGYVSYGDEYYYLDNLSVTSGGSSPTTYTLTTSATNGSVSPSGGTYNDGTVVTLTASPNTNYVFSGWSGDLSGTTNPANITMNSNKNVTADFTYNGGDDLPYSGPDYDLGLNGSGNFSEQVTINTSASGDVTLSLNLTGTGGLESSGGSQDNLLVTYQVDSGSQQTWISMAGGEGYNNTEEVTVSSGSQLIVRFTGNTTYGTEVYQIRNFSATSGGGSPTTYTLTTSASNGSVNPSSGTYNDGTVVTLTATPNTDYIFSGWSGDLSGSTNPVQLTMNSNKNVTANFTYNGSSSNLLTNGDFSSGISNWDFTPTSPSSGSATVQSGQCYVDITNDDGTNWHLRLRQINISMQNSTSYTASFDAKAQSNRSVILQVKNASGSCLWHTFNITTSMQNYTVTFTNNVATASDFEFLLFFGSQGTNDVWVDNALLEENLAKSLSEELHETARIIVPEKTLLAQNYPNPFNPETTIPYQLSEATHVKLEIINFLGQRVATLVNEYQTVGSYHVRWNGRADQGTKAASGIYIYRLVTDNSVQMKKFILAQ